MSRVTFPLLTQCNDSRGIGPEAVGGAVLPSSAGGCRDGFRRSAALPLDVRGPVLSCAFNRFAALCAALAISRSSADRGLGTRQVPSIDS
jgi:hypothetical protein